MSSSPMREKIETLWARYRPGELLHRAMPRGLFPRSLIIIVAPIFLLLAIVSYIFFERELDITTRRMARDVAADAAFLVALEDSYRGPERLRLRALAEKQLRYRLTFFPGAKVAPPKYATPRNTIDRALDDTIGQQIGEDRNFETHRLGPRYFSIGVQANDGVLYMKVPRERVTVSAPDLFVAWMVGASLILLGISILFLRNQVRPIEQLARAAEAYGKGRDVPDFKPYGATEVRRAAQAFITMRQRIARHLQQRTDMLSGVSHDLKTPLTRMRLQLAMMPPSPETKALTEDAEEMERMVVEYLDFARGEGGEKPELADIGALIREAAAVAARGRAGGAERLGLDVPEGVLMAVKAYALKRCAGNLIDNALKHAAHVRVSLVLGGRFAQILVDDDGPGIAEDRREEAFRPFHRLDQGRNLQSGGVGLGLAIARDFARAHGGDLVLSQSPLGGLRATITLPV
jgi:two-component system, OmpR family, osmolarity sensor histidine kinase EnvZ